MDKGIGAGNLGGIEENAQQKALLAWATARIDLLADQDGGTEYLGQFLDWLAFFTREHFGFQQRMLNGYSEHREYLLNRVAVHCEFRKRLAQLCIDTMRRDPSAPDRLRELCHDLLTDAQAQHETLCQLMRNDPAGARLRKNRRRGELATTATQLFEYETSASSEDTPALTH